MTKTHTGKSTRTRHAAPPPIESEQPRTPQGRKRGGAHTAPVPVEFHANDAAASASVLGFLDADARRERIARRAYELYVARGFVDGSDVDDWLQAEIFVDSSLG